LPALPFTNPLDLSGPSAIGCRQVNAPWLAQSWVMIVFATVKCSRLDRIASNGFEAEDDAVARCVSGEKAGTATVYCSDEPVNDCELSADFHIAYVLEVPDEVLEKHVISGSGGWLLPIDVANEYRGIGGASAEGVWPCAIDLDPNVSTPIANLEDVERGGGAGWVKTVGDAIQKRRAARETQGARP
jgi:hypothetical protein